MNKRTYFLVVVLAGLAFIVVCFLSPDQVTQPIRNETQALFGPLIRTVETPVHYFSHMDSKLTTLDQAQAEVTKLRARVADLELRNQLLTDKAAENARLREMLGFREASQYRLRACRVVSRSPSNWWGTVQVNVGWEDEPGLTKDQPVVSPRGVVGKTGTVTRETTDVILMVNINCSISAIIEGTHDHGIVQGQGNFDEGKPRVLVDYLPKESQVAVGQFIVTSGLGPYFPAGLRLGTVVEVPPLKNEYPTFGLYREAIIEPTADLDQLDELFIVLGSKQEAKPEEKPDSTPTSDSPPSADTTPPSNPTPAPDATPAPDTAPPPVARPTQLSP